MKKISVLLVLGLSILFGFQACDVSFETPELKDIKNVRFVSLKNNVLQLKLDPVITNPNPVSFWVDKFETDLKIEGINAGKGFSDKRIEVKASGDSRFTMDISAEVKGLKRKLIPLLAKDSIKIEFDGRYTFKNDIKDITVPYTYEMYIDPKKELGNLIMSF